MKYSEYFYLKKKKKNTNPNNEVNNCNSTLNFSTYCISVAQCVKSIFTYTNTPGHAKQHCKRTNTIKLQAKIHSNKRENQATKYKFGIRYAINAYTHHTHMSIDKNRKIA